MNSLLLPRATKSVIINSEPSYCVSTPCDVVNKTINIGDAYECDHCLLLVENIKIINEIIELTD